MNKWHTAIWAEQFPGGLSAQSLLLVAPRGSGATDFARTLAKAGLCATPETNGLPCDICEDCRWFDAGSHPDFRLVDVATAADAKADPDAAVADDTAPTEKAKRVRPIIPIDRIRALEDLMHLASHRGRARIVVIDHAHAMNTAAANALLKMLEEPPAGAQFILLTSQPARLLPTIRSRCLRLTLPGPSRDEAIEVLASSEGGRAALALDQTGGSPGMVAELGERFWAVREMLMPVLSQRDPDWISVAGRTTDLELPPLLHLLQTWCFDLLSSRLTGAVRYHTDLGREAAAVSRRIDPLDLCRYDSRLRAARRLIDHPLNARLFAEDLLLDYARVTAS